MSTTIIKAENISKLYRLGEIGTGTLSHDLNKWVAKVRGRENPYAKVGEINDRTSKGLSDFVWSLKDINFSVNQGEVLGIIGRNGAGKSTLLKILSKVTSPTTGSIKVKGRIASLLEVGTGFHPELTGRENVYLNGAILGMTKTEIKGKFDEIVDFSGVERYIDTPVKRYSSGMYVRLAFAVAAFLEPEILIVDEVLAVGDAEFQKKCLGRMHDVSRNDGRAVLFVSHNIAAVKQLCSRVIILKQGSILYSGEINEGTSKYQQDYSKDAGSSITLPIKDQDAFFLGLSVSNDLNENVSVVNYDEKLSIIVDFQANVDINDIEISLRIKNSNEVNVFFTSLSDHVHSIKQVNKGKYRCKVTINKEFLIPDVYTVSAYIHIINNRNIDYIEDVIQFNIIETGSRMARYGTNARAFACVFDQTLWQLNKIP